MRMTEYLHQNTWSATRQKCSNSRKLVIILLSLFNSEVILTVRYKLNDSRVSRDSKVKYVLFSIDVVQAMSQAMEQFLTQEIITQDHN